MGSAIFTFFVLAFGFYLWVRITKTMDLGKYLAYGIFVLVVEVRFQCTPLLLQGMSLPVRMPYGAACSTSVCLLGVELCSRASYMVPRYSPCTQFLWHSVLTGHGRDRDDAVRYHAAARSCAAGGI